MIEDDAKTQLDTTTGQKSLAFIFMIDGETGRPDFLAMPMQERRTAMDAFYAARKQPVIDALKTSKRISIVDELSCTPNLIAKGPVDAWRSVVSRHQALFDGPTVQVTANHLIKFDMGFS